MKSEIQTKGRPPNHKVGKECNPNDGSNERTSKKFSFFLQEKEGKISTQRKRRRNKYSERERERKVGHFWWLVGRKK